MAELAMCLAAGIIFAALAVWLTTRRGNTLRDILASSHADAQDLKVEVAGKFKVATNIPIVALYIVAAFVAVGLPLARQCLLTGRYHAWRVKGKLSPGSAQNVYAAVHPPTLPVAPDGSFDDWIPVVVDDHGEPVFPSITFHGMPDLSGHDIVVLHPMEDAPSRRQKRTGNTIEFLDELSFDRSWRGR